MPAAKTKATSKDVQAALASKPDTTEGAATGDVETLGGLTIESVSGMDNYINMLIYGEPGTGKTVLAGSSSVVEGMSPVLFIDVEGGTMPLRTMYPDVKVVRAKNFSELQKIYSSLYDGKHQFKTVVLDSVTEMQKMSMEGILRKHNQGVAPSDRLDTPRIQDWGTNLTQTRTMIRGFRDLPMNVIFTALNDEGEKNGKTTNRPLFQGKLKGEGPGFVDIVAFYYVKQRGDLQNRMLLTQATDTTMAKDRSTRLPKVMENPTMEVIYNTALGNIEAA